MEQKEGVYVGKSLICSSIQVEKYTRCGKEHLKFYLGRLGKGINYNSRDSGAGA